MLQGSVKGEPDDEDEEEEDDDEEECEQDSSEEEVDDPPKKKRLGFAQVWTWLVQAPMGWLQLCCIGSWLVFVSATALAQDIVS